MSNEIGIDLGTTHTVVARAGQALARTGEKPTVPSVIAYPPDAPLMIGWPAVGRAVIDAENTILSSKRLIGLPYDAASAELLQQQYGPELVATHEGTYGFRTRAGVIDPIRVGAHLLSFACRRLGITPVEVPELVVSVPAAFDTDQREATRLAAGAAGFAVVNLVAEPIATAVAYLHRAGLHRAAVYDLGGGTFDVAVVDCSTEPFQVLAHDGDLDLGGDDIDMALADLLAEELLQAHGWDLRTERMVYRRLVRGCERAKRKLRKRDSIKIEATQVDRAAPSHLPPIRVTREHLAMAATPLLDRTFAICDRVLDEAKLKPGDIDAVFLAGGTCRMDLLKQRVEKYFGKRPRTDLDPLHVVALGASFAAIRPGLIRLRNSGAFQRPSKPMRT